MCGIHAIVDKSRSISPQAIEQMVASASHRGPDDSGTHMVSTKQGDIYFGANRLAITDLTSSAAQPMIDGDNVLCFNGEVYNFPNLRNELRPHVTFSSQSDTEVLHHLLSKSPEFERLAGMYGIIFLRGDTLILARDPAGMKKIYYYEDEKVFIASSEIRSILASGLVQKSLNENAIDDYLTFKYVRPPATFFSGIYEVLPGEQLHRDEHGTRKEKTGSVASESGTLDELLARALLNHVPHNQPASMLFSGGVDSSLMLAMLHREGIHPQLFTFVPEAADASHAADDHTYAKAYARSLGLPVEKISIDREQFWNRFDPYVASLDQPVGDSAGFITWTMAEQISTSHKVALSGAGADELFGGYNRHRAFWKYLNHPNLTRFRSPGAALSRFVPGRRGALFAQFFNGLNPIPGRTFANFISFIHSTEQTLWDSQPDIASEMRAALDHDLHHFLVSDVLAINDMAGMQHGLEIRSPYLDPSIVHYARSTPALQLMDKGSKWMLKEMLDRMGGHRISRRKKEGFGLPLRTWFHSSNRELFTFEQSSILYKFVSQSVVNRFVDEHIRGKNDHGTRLFGLLLLHKWLQREFS